MAFGKYLRFLLVGSLWASTLLGPLSLLAPSSVLAPAQAQTAADEVSVQTPPSLSDVEELRERLNASTELDPDAKETASQLLDEAALAIQSAESNDRDAAALQNLADTAEQRLSEADAAIANPEGAEPIDTEDVSVSALGTLLREAQSELADAEKELAGAASEPSRRQTREQAIPGEQQQLEESIAKAKKQIAADADSSTIVDEARLLRTRTAILADEAKQAKLRTELLAYAATVDLLPLQRQLAEQKVDHLHQRIARLQQAIAKTRQQQINTLRARVESAADGAPSELLPVADKNRTLLDRYENLAKRSQQVKQELGEVRRLLDEVKTREQEMNDRVEAVGLTEALALMLQREKSLLARTLKDHLPDASLRTEMRDLQVETFKLEDLATSTNGNGLPKLATPDSAETSPAATTPGPNQKDVSQSTLEQLQAEILRKLVPAGSTLFRDLALLDTYQRQLQVVIGRYLDFIEEKLLWTRNAPVITATAPGPAFRGIAWIFSLNHWKSVPDQLGSVFLRAPITVSLLAIVIAFLVFGRPYFRQTLKTEAANARRSNCVELRPTIRASFVTLLMAAPIPTALLGLGWILGRDVGDNVFLSSLASGLRSGSFYLAPLFLLLETCRADGVGIDHFSWNGHVCKRMRQACRDLATVGGPLTVLAELLHAQPDDAISDSLGRYAEIALMVVIIVELHMLLRPSHMWAGYHGLRGWAYRYRRAIYAVAMQIPLSVILLISLGYEYMTFAVLWNLGLTGATILVVVLLEAIAIRGLLVRRRRLSMEQLRQRRAANDTEVADSVGIDVSAADSDLGSVSKHAQQLVRLSALSVALLAIGWIWADVLPGLKMLDRITLWETGTTTLIPVTLRDLTYCLLILGVTAYAVKSLPALIELLFLQQLQPGARYAVTTIFRYVVGAAGGVMAFSCLSIPWSQLSWIVAAASVGLGFGLQEILANFVSGIILLLEQPIRVGDIVTVDDSTGVVTKMQIRATTITNWDRQELVVPNKDFVTGKVLNWTLSNVINRLVIHVGVGYASDPKHVHQILLDILADHEEVMEDPAPMVTLEQFADSSLNFVVRCYLPTLEKRLSTIHELHAEIVLRFREADIEIPFPQRDIRMTVEPADRSDYPAPNPETASGPVSPTTGAPLGAAVSVDLDADLGSK